MIAVTFTFTITVGHEQEAMKLMEKMAAHMRNEPGILSHQLYQSQKEPRNFFVYIQFTDQTAFDTDRGTDYYGTYVMTNLYGMLEADSVKIDIYKPLFEQEMTQQ